MGMPIEVGKYTLESLTSGMYVSPKVFYREYIQNSVDAIDEAVKNQIITMQDSKVIIDINKNNGCISIYDNGTGIPNGLAYKTLTDLGNSKKIYSDSRGFRGIGRLSGLSFCEKLTFTTSFKGESKKSIISYDSNLLKKLLLPDENNDHNLMELIDAVTDFSTENEASSIHYFEVIMEGVRDIEQILDTNAIREYLCQVAPLPFNIDTFKWASEIRNKLKTKNLDLKEYNIYIQKDKELHRLFKPYKDTLLVDKSRKLIDEVKDIYVDELVDEIGNLVAVIWFSITDMRGTILDDSIKGLRVRKGNILIGDKFTLNQIFKEDRFNGWFQGEVHVFSKKIVPNARRDDFEKNEAYLHLLKELNSIGIKLSKEIRTVSNNRNQDDKQLEVIEEDVLDSYSVLEEGFKTSQQKQDFTKKLETVKLNLVAAKKLTIEQFNKKLELIKQIDLILDSTKGVTKYKAINISKKLSINEKKLLEKVVDVILNEKTKKEQIQLVDAILEQIC